MFQHYIGNLPVTNWIAGPCQLSKTCTDRLPSFNCWIHYLHFTNHGKIVFKAPKHDIYHPLSFWYEPSVYTSPGIWGIMKTMYVSSPGQYKQIWYHIPPTSKVIKSPVTPESGR